MKMNKEYDYIGTPTSSFNTDVEDAAKARRRWDLICAQGIEQENYKYNPNAARNNERPAQPMDENEVTDYSD